MNIIKLNERYVIQGHTLSHRLRRSLELSTDAAVQHFLAEYTRARGRNVRRVQRWKELLVYERRLWGEGRKFIGGVDEVGIASLAGPVLAAAVVLPRNCRLLDVDDSKRLNETERERLAGEIKRVAIAWGIGMATPEEIDKLNILQADFLAMKRALASISSKVLLDYILVDYHTLPDITVKQLGITNGDQKSLSIAAASIIAKTTRDAIMRDYDKIYPGYDFTRNKGYGTQRHKTSIHTLGVLPIHRRTFKSVREALLAGVPIRVNHDEVKL